MNDRAISLLEQYDIEVLRTRKGRGAFIFDTKQGTILMKEYTGSPEKLALQQQILQQVGDTGLVKTERLIPNKEGQLYVKDNDGVIYIVKTCFEGSECNIYDGRECVEAMQVLAKLHVGMERTLRECEGVVSRQPAGEVQIVGAEQVLSDVKAEILPAHVSPLREYDKHNRELMRIWSYLKKKGQKQVFELRLLGVMEYFVTQAKKVTESWRALEIAVTDAAVPKANPVLCHGDYQYHNVIRTQEGWCVLNFEKMLPDNPVRDVYLFMRKVMEKNNWSVMLGKEMMSAYGVIRTLEKYDMLDLYHRFAYPEKFWKIANFYYNSNKAWIPEKNLEKLEKVISQEQEKNAFLQEIFRGQTIKF